ncbi:hypothetical protein Tco_1121328 [Tanacetum coccineum]|uniref:Uncharacterized protein n=1 Tax=Tanacetum coccineum TaxID=301880 RepID=A0ABQ5IXF1_9ASTR
MNVHNRCIESIVGSTNARIRGKLQKDNLNLNPYPLLLTQVQTNIRQKTNPSPRPSPTIPIPDSIPEGSGRKSMEVIIQKEIIKEVDAKGVCINKRMRKPAKSEPTVHKDPAFDDLDDVDVNAMDYMETDAYMQKGVRRKVSTDKLDEGTAEPKDGTSNESTAPTTVFRDDETIAEFLGYNNKISTYIEASSLKIDPKDKGKKVLEEEAESDAESEGVDEAERNFDQLAKDEEIARKARIEADRILATKASRMKKRETFLAQQRAAAIRSRPPTRTQLRNQMMTYLKHVGGKKHADLKNKNFEEIQVLYKKVKRSDKNFIAIGSAEDERQIKEMNEESKDPKKKRVVNETPREEDTAKVPAEQEVTEQGTKKRKSGHVKMIARKRPRPQPNDDSDDEHIKCLRIVTFDSTIDSEIMETKSFVSKLHKVSSPDGDYLVVYRVNGHFRAFNYLMEALHIFSRQDLFHLYDLVMKQYSKITTKKVLSLILWGRLEDMIGILNKRSNNQELKDGTVIYMLVERRYPLSKELLQRMLDLGLEVEEESTAALHLVRFIKQQLNEE